MPLKRISPATPLSLLLVCFLLLFISAQKAFAIYDPLSVPNNRYGVHILDTGEIEDAAKLVNSSGGDWGYVTIPIRSNDRDEKKWHDFFIRAAQLHIIPILRLATYPDRDHWVAPNAYDLVDFANFLNTMPWPTNNRYIILFNEPNHSNEWGGELSPLEYANLVVDAYTIFKTRSADFFLLTAGLDMSAPTNVTSIDALQFYRRMTAYRPDWYRFIDGISVHAYPNPAFSASPYSPGRFGITSFRYETQLLKTLGFSGKPLFITETGSFFGSSFYGPAFTDIWQDRDIVAITPFILFAGTGDFAKFSLLDLNHQPTESYQIIVNTKKQLGSPLLAQSAQAINSPSLLPPGSPSSIPNFIERIKQFLVRKSPVITIGQARFEVEISDTPAKRAQGLSGRSVLADNKGMLFIFPQATHLSFWMKEMRFPLDFIWINDQVVVELTRNVPHPESNNGQTAIIRPDKEADMVLEVNAGMIDRYNIKLSDRVNLEK